GFLLGYGHERVIGDGVNQSEPEQGDRPSMRHDCRRARGSLTHEIDSSEPADSMVLDLRAAELDHRIELSPDEPAEVGHEPRPGSSDGRCVVALRAGVLREHRAEASLWCRRLLERSLPRLELSELALAEARER